MKSEQNIKNRIREVDDFPTEGIKFYDISPLLADNTAFTESIRQMSEPLRNRVDKLVAFDARGFLFASAMALELGVGLSMLRKPGKLPGETESVSYDLEYGTNCLEIQRDAVVNQERIALVDDVIATGGTALAGINLVRKLGGNIINFSAFIDLPSLGGSSKIREAGVDVNAVVEL